MILGLEGIHTFNDLTLNDLSDYPRYKLTSIVGLRSTADFDPVADEAITRKGEIPRLGERTGKSITYEGVIECQNHLDLLQMSEALGTAFDTTDELRMDSEPHADYDGEDELPSRFFFARPISCDVSEEYADSVNLLTKGYELPFSIVLRLSDPRYYWTDAEDTAEDDTPSALGGAGVPFTPGGSSGGPSSEGYEVTVDLDGTSDVDATFRLHGPLGSPVLSNESLDKFLRFRKLHIDDGDYVDIDFRNRTVLKSTDPHNKRQTLDPASTWWDRGVPCLTPGENVIRLRGYRVGTGSKLKVTYNPADRT
jgi:hypothetical protein